MFMKYIMSTDKSSTSSTMSSLVRSRITTRSKKRKESTWLDPFSILPQTSIVPAFMRAASMSDQPPASNLLTGQFLTNTIVKELEKWEPINPTKIQPRKQEDEVNMSIVTDESCPDIESDAETMISTQQTIPRIIKMRNPSIQGRNMSKSPSKSPTNVKVCTKRK